MRVIRSNRVYAWLLASLAAPVAVGDIDVTIQDFEFSPATVTIQPGEKVRWTNLDAIRHTVTSQAVFGTGVPSGLFGSPLIATNTTFEVTFNTEGTYFYFCTPHGVLMQGTVIVESGCEPDLTTGAVPGQPGYGVPDGTLNNDDFFYYLAQFAAGNVAVADLTSGAVSGQVGYGVPNGIVNNDDFFYYLAIFAAGCGDSAGSGAPGPAGSQPSVSQEDEQADLLLAVLESAEHRDCCRKHE